MSRNDGAHDVVRSGEERGATSTSGALFISGMYKSKKSGTEFLISEISFVVIRHGESNTCSKFNLNKKTRRIVAGEGGVWKYDFVFSPDFTFIESGECVNLSTGKILVYGSGQGELLYQRSEVYMVLNRAKKSDLHEPAMYRLNDDHIAFVFCEYSFVVLMAGKLHYSTSFVYHKATRRVIAEAHRWMFDFIFSKDFSYVERGTYHSLTSREAHIFGTASGQLLFQRMDGKLMTNT